MSAEWAPAVERNFRRYVTTPTRATRARGSAVERDAASSYAVRRRLAFDPDDWERLFRADGQGGLFDPPLEGVTPRIIRARAAVG
jgi:hypothetical protein